MSREPILRITDDESRALHLCAQSLTNAAIAHEMAISKWTARNHLLRLSMLLNAPSRVGLVVLAHQHGLVDLDKIRVKRRVIK